MATNLTQIRSFFKNKKPPQKKKKEKKKPTPLTYLTTQEKGDKN